MVKLRFPRGVAALACVVLLLPAAARAGTYYFSVTGNDANDGRSPATPRASLDLVPGCLRRGDSVLLRRGDRWYVDSLEWNLDDAVGTPASPVRLGAYGTGARPVVARMDTSTWTRGPDGLYAGDPAWRRSEADTVDEVVRLYLGGTPLPRVARVDSLADSTYCVAGGRIFVRASGGAPRQAFEYVRDACGPITARRARYLTVSDLELWGGAGWVAVRVDAPTDHVRFEHVVLRRFLSYGIEFTVAQDAEGRYLATTDRHVAPAVIGCTIDRGWSRAMNHERRYTVRSHRSRGPVTLGAQDGESGGDGVNFNDAVEAGVVRGCSITDMGHSGIANELHNPANYGTRHCLVEEDTVTAGASDYCRAIGFGYTSRCRFTIIRRNDFHDVNVQSQLGGESTFVYSNVFERTNVSPVRRAAYAIASYVVAGEDHEAFGARDLVFANNTIVGSDAALYATGAAGDSGLVRHDVFANNLVADWRTSRCARCGDAGIATALLVDSTRAVLANWSFRGNGFWSGTGDSTALAVVGPGRLDRYTPSQLNARPGCAGNRFANPAFAKRDSAAGPVLAPDSPFASGGVPLASLLPPGVEAVDFTGRPFARDPSVGAFQVPFVARAGVAARGGPRGHVPRARDVRGTAGRSRPLPPRSRP